MEEVAEPRAMTNDELAAHIDHCSRQLLAAQALIEGGSPDYFALLGERNRWKCAMEEALRERARRPAVVAAMEQARGLA